MPTSKKRKKGGRPVAPPPRPRPARAGAGPEFWDVDPADGPLAGGDLADRMTAFVPVPAFAVEVRDPVGRPLWFVGGRGEGDPCDHYRVWLPAKAAGGEVRGGLRADLGDRRGPQAIALDRPDHLRRIARAAVAGRRIVLHGVSATLNVFPFRGPRQAEVVAPLLAALTAAGCPAWAEGDDDYAAVAWGPWFEAGFRATTGREPSRADRLGIGAMAEWTAGASAEACAAFYGAAAGAVVSTPPVAAMVRRLAPGTPVRVVPNAVDPDHAGPWPRPAGGPVRVGYAGSPLKYAEDVPLALPALLAAARRPGVELHFWAGHPGAAARPVERPGVFAVGGVPYRAHPGVAGVGRFVRELAPLDVAVGPLAGTPPNRARSHGKWMEAALNGTAIVVSDLEPFAGLADGEVLLKATTPEEWTEKVLALVGDDRLRRRIGEAARELVLAEHTIEARAPLWRALVAEAAAMARGEPPAEAA